MPEKTEAQKRAQKNYMQKFSIARVRMEHDKYESVQSAAAGQGQSVNAYINQAINERMERDGADAGRGNSIPDKTETPSDGIQDAMKGEKSHE